MLDAGPAPNPSLDPAYLLGPCAQCPAPAVLTCAVRCAAPPRSYLAGLRAHQPAPPCLPVQVGCLRRCHPHPPTPGCPDRHQPPRARSSWGRRRSGSLSARPAGLSPSPRPGGAARRAPVTPLSPSLTLSSCPRHVAGPRLLPSARGKEALPGWRGRQVAAPGRTSAAGLEAAERKGSGRRCRGRSRFFSFPRRLISGLFLTQLRSSEGLLPEVADVQMDSFIILEVTLSGSTFK